MSIHNQNVHHRLDTAHHCNMVTILNKYVFVHSGIQNDFLDIDIHNRQDN